MHEQILRRLHTGFDLEPLYTGLYNPRRPPTPEQFTLDMNVEVESLRLEVLLSQPLPPPQHDSSPRRSPAAGTGLDEPGVPQPDAVYKKRSKREISLFKPVSMAFCTLIERGFRNRRELYSSKWTSGYTPKQQHGVARKTGSLARAGNG